MSRFCLLFFPAWLASVTGVALAQDRIDPAREIRVVELVDNKYSQKQRIIAEDLTPAEILRVQVELKRAGHDPGSRSGQLDGGTRRALTSFQSARGLEICGCVTYETVVALGIRPEIVARVEGADTRASSTVIVDQREPLVIFVPGHRLDHRRGFFGGPSVVVGHEPAVGAGQLFRRRFPAGSERHRITDRPPRGRDTRPLPTSPHSGGRIQPGDRGRPASAGGGLRPSRPRP